MSVSSVPNSRLVQIPANPHGRDFAVGDIHGSFRALEAAMDSIGFDRTRDRLFAVGDLVDRGPESEQVLHWLDQPWFFAICGNHDFMIWRSALGDPYPLVDVMAHGGSWLQQLKAPEKLLLGLRLQQLPLVMEIATPQGPVGLVHGDYPFDDWQQVYQQMGPGDEDMCLWSRERYLHRYARPVRNVRAVVHGHTTLPSMMQLGNVYFIDTGGWKPGQGHFTFLELQSLTALRGPGPVGVNLPHRYR